MNPIAPFDAAWAVVPILLLVIGMVVAVLVVLLIIWILYTIIWKGVKRGLEEFHGTRAQRETPAEYFGFATWNPPDESQDPSAGAQPGGERRHRSGRLTR